MKVFIVYRQDEERILFERGKFEGRIAEDMSIIRAPSMHSALEWYIKRMGITGENGFRDSLRVMEIGPETFRRVDIFVPEVPPAHKRMQVTLPVEDGEK